MLDKIHIPQLRTHHYIMCLLVVVIVVVVVVAVDAEFVAAADTVSPDFSTTRHYIQRLCASLYPPSARTVLHPLKTTNFSSDKLIVHVLMLM